MIFSETQVEELNKEFEHRSPQEVIKWMYGHAAKPVTLVGPGLGGGVLLHMERCLGVSVSGRKITIDTGLLPQESNEAIEQLAKRFRVVIEPQLPREADLATLQGPSVPSFFKENKGARLSCCYLRKVLPLKRALTQHDVWMSSLREDNTLPDRTSLPVFMIDKAHGGILKINPLAGWSTDDGRHYICTHNIPYNRLFDMGYGSIECKPCSRPGKDREGIWWWEDHSEKICGIHNTQPNNQLVDIRQADDATSK